MGRFPDFSAEHAFLKHLPGVEIRIPEYYSELPMLKSLFEVLSQDRLFSAFRWVIARVFEDRPEHFSTPLDQQTVMFYLSNEDFRLPTYIHSLAMLFTPYWWPGYPFENLRAIPLGCNGEVPEIEPCSWQERDLHLFFSGHAHQYRPEFQKYLQGVLQSFRPAGEELSALAVWSSRFRGGLEPELYARYLARSQVALVPRGNSAMTYRLFEAMRAGCVLLCEDLPPVWYLENCQRVVMPADWHSLQTVLEQLWRDPVLMQEMHLSTLQNYRQVCRPEAVAEYVLKELKTK
ncbi:hypothetical protein COW36_04520 [bacterium (Candidatus Blackallbacteria) CG17_big_fil_post_rev_8_21_14_2_50_48_46]|uniref:Exostosin GT47 domain-containing protein n=1 Tax=bacterium (Candidatus Blackallbacteria) CG17_big_fil_post_rev_8_21_14_2_50_48_46 TaxID=2014261 RepID=A0A2M7G8W9_9BACT|nr:MAG: hypothetical protein COW64_04425 [bacterium (Candidatus Blackallbacteria) CG18_big_fil_WC_8_21_14_2_50_49_26]PIW18562.1 MAG: hypothetical protein COW36_04520 [bacterium (Candidatus Blackallbacteria) CG17_big_fil_post_rev_8_21_14_2_50_48_46]PIW46453.1 MAG: hypothetical protein COW20_16160 [bacterium (Candidatus Blackallbacteria) CG13_big_fil_rev_8_21_14_2_50_49_14]